MNISIDDKLIAEAQKLGRKKTRKEAVTEALVEYVQRRKQREIIQLFGRIDYNPGVDCKKLRSRLYSLNEVLRGLG